MGTAGCNAKRDVLRSLQTLTGRAELIYHEAEAAEAELETAAPYVAGTPGEAPLQSAKARQGVIQLEASTAKDELGVTSKTVENKLKNISTFPWWAKYIVLPIVGLVVLVLGASFLGSAGVPLFTSLAAWLARKGFGFGKAKAQLAERLAVAQTDGVAPEVIVDRIATQLRSNRQADIAYEQARKARKIERALNPKPLTAPLVPDGR